ncbi:MAG: hypothetical protein RBT46_00125, partial [Weeksellaceae bacterium]|nr:hypothetical protein [Weeksellaceae bacterium]
MKLTKNLIPIFLLFITVEAIAQCPSGAQPYTYNITTISNGQTYCVSGEINNLWGLTIASGGKLIVLPDSKLTIGNNLTL